MTLAYERRVISCLLVFTFLNGMLWSMVVPIWQPPDETTHFATAQFIAEHKRLPGASDIYASDEIARSVLLLETWDVVFKPEVHQNFSNTLVGPNEAGIFAAPTAKRKSYESKVRAWGHHLPPLYYLFSALPYLCVKHSDLLARVMAVRYGSILLTVGVVLGSWWIARILWPTNVSMRITVPVLVSFHPMFTHTGAVVNTDILLILIYTLVLYLGLCVLRDGLNKWYALAIGFVLGCGMLTKPFILGVFPAVGLALLWDLYDRDWKLRSSAINWVFIFLAFALTYGWWVVRSVFLGDSPIYADAMEFWGMPPNPDPNFNLYRYLIFYSTTLREGLFRSYWGVFGSLDTLLPMVVYNILRWVVVLSGLGLVWGRYRTLISARRRRLSAILVFYLLVASLALIPLLGIYEYSFMKANGIPRGYQGRYYLGPIVTQMALLAMGLLAFVPKRWVAFGHWMLRAAMIFFNFFCIISALIPRYYL